MRKVALLALLVSVCVLLSGCFGLAGNELNGGGGGPVSGQRIVIKQVGADGSGVDATAIQVQSITSGGLLERVVMPGIVAPNPNYWLKAVVLDDLGNKMPQTPVTWTETGDHVDLGNPAMAIIGISKEEKTHYIGFTPTAPGMTTVTAATSETSSSVTFGVYATADVVWPLSRDKSGVSRKGYNLLDGTPQTDEAQSDIWIDLVGQRVRLRSAVRVDKLINQVTDVDPSLAYGEIEATVEPAAYCYVFDLGGGVYAKARFAMAYALATDGQAEFNYTLSDANGHFPY